MPSESDWTEQNRLGYFIPSWLNILNKSLSLWIVHRSSSRGAALSFYTLLSIPPMAVIAMTVGGHLIDGGIAQNELVEQLQSMVGFSGAQAIVLMLSSTTDESSGWLAACVSGLFVLFGAAGGIAELKGSLDEVWETDKVSSSRVGILLRTHFLSIVVLLILGLVAVASAIASTAWALFGQFAADRWRLVPSLMTPIAFLISFASMTSLFAVIYKTLPDVPLSWRDAWVGAVITGALFALGNVVISYYLKVEGPDSVIGAAGSLMAFFLWLYYSSQLFFLGSEITRQYTLTRGSLRERRGAPVDRNR